jgi:hypothetical protein
MVSLEETLNKGFIDGSQQFLHRLVFLHGPLGGNRPLENAHTLRILIKYSINVFDSPERVLV